MRVVYSAAAAAVLLMICMAQTPAEARRGVYWGFGSYGPGFSIHVGRYPRYLYYGPYYYRPDYYRPYYYRPYYRSYRYPPYGGRCSYWSRRCAGNWGYGNHNYYGCLRYHRCR